jgi:hypothetical protein
MTIGSQLPLLAAIALPLSRTNCHKKLGSHITMQKA